MEQGKRKFMLHQIGLIARFQPFGKQRAPDISAIYEEEFKVPIGTHGGWTSQKAFHHRLLPFRPERNQFPGQLPSIEPVNDLLQISIAGGVKFHVSVHHELKRHIRSGKSHMFHQIRHIASFRGGRFQKLFPHGRIEKELSGDNCRTVRSTYLRKFFFHPAFQAIVNAGQLVFGFTDQFHHRNRRYAGKRLPPEPQALNAKQILC